MDSQFINYDGRSVHDMIQLLLAASGDPEAIRALQEAIAAVDAKFTPVNAELERLEDDKQDVGDYVNNGGAPGYVAFKFSEGSYVMDMRRANNQYTNGISIMGANSEPDLDGVSREWFRYERNSGQLQGYIYKSEDGATPTWQAAHIWTADDDTGWLVLDDAVKYRKKDGVLYVNINYNITFELAGGAWRNLYTLPVGFRPASTMNYEIIMRKANGNTIDVFPGQINASGAIQVLIPNDMTINSTTHNAIFASASFPV